MDVGEPALGNRDWEGFDMNMPVNFGLLALCAVFGPSGEVSVDSCPDKPGTQKSFCVQSAGVRNVVDNVENGGTSGRHTPVYVSPASLWLPTVCKEMVNAVGPEMSFWVSAQLFCSVSIA